MAEEIVYDLKAKVYQNRNPDDLFKIPNINYHGWHAFQIFIRSIPTDKTPILKRFLEAERSIGGETPFINTQAGQEISKKLIEEFNSTQKIDNSINSSTYNKLTEESIKAIQTFHNITDSNVKIDGWIGTQTRQLIIPYAVGFWRPQKTDLSSTRSTHWVTKPNGDQVTEPYPAYGATDDGWWVPMQFGNKRYVIKSKDNYDQKNNNIKGIYKTGNWLTELKKYNPNVHTNVEFITPDSQNQQRVNIPNLNLQWVLEGLGIPFRNELLLDYNQTEFFNPIWDFEQNYTKRYLVLPGHDEDVKSKNYFTTEQPLKPNPWPIPIPIPTIPQRLNSGFYKKAEVDFINGTLIPKVITLLS